MFLRREEAACGNKYMHTDREQLLQRKNTQARFRAYLENKPRRREKGEKPFEGLHNIQLMSARQTKLQTVNNCNSYDTVCSKHCWLMMQRAGRTCIQKHDAPRDSNMLRSSCKSIKISNFVWMCKNLHSPGTRHCEPQTCVNWNQYTPAFI